MITRTIFLAFLILLYGCEDHEQSANKLLVESIQAWEKAQSTDTPEEQLRYYDLVDNNLKKIISEYSGSSVATKLALGDTLGPIDRNELENNIRTRQPEFLDRKRRVPLEIETILKDGTRSHYLTHSGIIFGFDQKRFDFHLNFQNYSHSDRTFTASVTNTHFGDRQDFKGSFIPPNRLTMQSVSGPALYWNLHLNEKGIFEHKSIDNSNISVTLDVSPSIVQLRALEFPIKFGEGMAGIKIGDTIQRAKDILGEPNDKEELVVNNLNEPQYHVISYRYHNQLLNQTIQTEPSIILAFGADPKTKKITIIDLISLDWFLKEDGIWKDRSSQVSPMLVSMSPKIEGVLALGSPSNSVRSTLGEPLHYEVWPDSCGGDFPDESFVYKGGSLRVCGIVTEIRIE